MFVIVVLSLILQIPALMIQSLITERQERRDNAANEIRDSWGGRQVISGPILAIPFKANVRGDNDYITQVTRHLYFLPDKLLINGVLDPEIRNRGIYDAIIYDSKLDISGQFNYPDLGELNIPPEDVLWKDAFLLLGISDMKGISNFVSIQWNNDSLTANPGIPTYDITMSGISVKPPVSGLITNYNFKIDLDLNGSAGIFFTPVGKETSVQIASSWTNPGFSGSFLPVTRKLDAAGFQSEWKVFHLNRNFPQAWIGSQYSIAESEFGVNLLLKVDEYQKTMRTVKYSIMFISLTFLTFFMIELLNRKKIHPIQYILIGLALLIFYTILLSLAEHMVFKYAYLLAAAGIITLIMLYTKSVLADIRQTAIITGVMVILYGYLYIILQLQDYALLMGSLGLFVILALVMYLTRKIDWFSVMTGNETGNKP